MLYRYSFAGVCNVWQSRSVRIFTNVNMVFATFGINTIEDREFDWLGWSGKIKLFCRNTGCGIMECSILVSSSWYTHGERGAQAYSVNLHLRDGRRDKHARQQCPPWSSPSCRRRCDSSTVSRHKRTDRRTDRRRKSNLVQLRHLVAITLMNFLIIYHTSCIY